MVYGGKPSTGCYLCRKRKIKCDEALPGCRNCNIYGRPCPGYRPDAVFRNETQKVEQLVKKSGSSSAGSSQSQIGNQKPVISQQTGALVPQHKPSRSPTGADPSLSLYSVADATWEQRAVCYFFDQYTIGDDENEGMSHLDFLPALYARCGEVGNRDTLASECLRWAMDSTALVALANATDAAPLTIKARQGYGKALRGLRQILSSPTQAVKDETFAVVVLLSLYEDIAGERNGLFSSHRAGFELLMKLRGQDQFGNRQGRDLFKFAYTHTYVEVLALGDKPRFNAEWVLGLLDSNDPIQSLMTSASKITQIFMAMHAASSPPDQETVKQWITAARECDVELSLWGEHLPERWLPLVCYSAKGEPLITYSRISTCVVWNYYRAARVLCQQLLLTLITISSDSHPPSAPAVDAASLRAVIQDMTTDLCRSIPFSLGDVDSLGRPTVGDEAHTAQTRLGGYGMLWPLWYVLRYGLPTPAQVTQIRHVLVRVGSTMGIKLALLLAREAECLHGGDAISEEA
ncbi:hypothetical protein N7474_011114 [Penicillium riverlandense]|uniref:uncharacterized protein n=1 Tax=Penicillium riverlandense TaxID=1903569 RepID=UPI002546BD83|nr:uncharacterized protein N7474_011114 [Penicillium riverlandense]KAJ5805227.1 hypothetical protein N7474_011114 [Penicillium riverlandense]